MGLQGTSGEAWAGPAPFVYLMHAILLLLRSLPLSLPSSLTEGAGERSASSATVSSSPASPMGRAALSIFPS